MLLVCYTFFKHAPKLLSMTAAISELTDNKSQEKLAKGNVSSIQIKNQTVIPRYTMP